VAYDDNPEKVLPFFLGEGSPEVADFRSLVERRHTRVTRASAQELVEPITTGILESVSTGRVVRPLLLAEVDRRIERARMAIAAVPVVLEPHVVVDGLQHPAADIIGKGRCVALAGIGGSGKTMTTAIALRRAASDGRTLPIYVVASENVTTPIELVRQRLNAARFSPSDDLVERWGAEGRILLVVDGVESLTAPTRRQLMSAIAGWAERFPRCGVAVCARKFSPLELPEFVHAAAAPLGQAEMRDLIEALGVGDRALHFSEQVREIALWPMWATALVVYGIEARTGLELLQRLVDARLRTAGMSSSLEAAELRAAAGFVAHSLWPATTSTIPETLEWVRQWRTESATGARFAPRPAEDVLQRLGEAALLEVGDDVEFPHRLLATILAAEHVVADSGAAVSIDEELAPFVAALADDDRHIELLRRILGTHDVFVVARYLRLSPPRERSVTLEADLQRFAAAHRMWSRDGTELDMAFGEVWIAWRPASVAGSCHCDDDEYVEWRSQSDEAIDFWPSLPFAERTPEFVAAVYILGKFRSRVLDLEPSSDQARTMPPNDVRALMRNRTEVTASVVGALNRRRQAHRDLLAELGMLDVGALRPPEGNPCVTIWHQGQREALVHVSWGGDHPVVNVVASAPALAQGRTGLLADLLGGLDRAAAYGDVKRNIEMALGCRLSSQSWSRPELVPAWAW
jgi:hypothetical protein